MTFLHAGPGQSCSLAVERFVLAAVDPGLRRLSAVPVSTKTREDSARAAADFTTIAGRDDVRGFILGVAAVGEPLQRVINAYVISGDRSPSGRPSRPRRSTGSSSATGSATVGCESSAQRWRRFASSTTRPARQRRWSSSSASSPTRPREDRPRGLLPSRSRAADTPPSDDVGRSVRHARVPPGRTVARLAGRGRGLPDCRERGFR